ncbi:MAG: fumarylacetoacetate hydrolase family protein [Burkholderiaceae bacterium]|nr:fumarylacetoacetate hydrolase family protein [Burkholderiaceae bacterium]
MKLASYRDGSRDGQLVVVSRDLGTAHYATGAACTLQQALDDWNFVSPQLQDLSLELNRGRARHAFAFDPAMCLAPLPRASQCVRGTAYPSHRERLRQAGLRLPLGAVTRASAPDWWALPGDAMQGARDPVALGDEAWDLDFEAGLAVITGDIAAGSAPARALEGVRLLMLANTWCLRAPQAKAWADGLGDAHTRPGQSFGPVAVTPDELGDAWHHGRLAMTLHTQWNGRRMGVGDTAAHMGLHWGQLLAQLSAHRALHAGSVVAGGPVSAPSAEVLAGAGVAVAEPSPVAAGGVHCIAERRALELLDHGKATTGYLCWGDEVRVELKSRDGFSPLGALQQQVVEPAQA